MASNKKREGLWLLAALAKQEEATRIIFTKDQIRSHFPIFTKKHPRGFKTSLPIRDNGELYSQDTKITSKKGNQA